ncbi:MAG: hypothetical protein RLZ44_1413 [Pseudomonadota bacterium]
MRWSSAGTRVAWTLYLLAFCLWQSAAWALADDAIPTAGTQQFQTAPVVVNGEVLFTTIGIEAYPAVRRARKIEQAIEALAEDATVEPEKLSVVAEKDQHWLVLGDTKIMGLVDEDARFVGIDSRELLAEIYRQRIADVIKAYRLDRTPERIRDNLLHAGVRTLGLILILALMWWLFRLADRFLEKYFKRRIQKLEAKSMRVIQAEQIWGVVSAAVSLLKTVVVVAVVYVFLNYVATLFPWTRYLAQRLLQLVVDPLQVMALGFVAYLPSLFFLLVLFVVVRYLLRALYGFFEAVHHGNLRLKSFEAEWAWPTYRIVRLVTVIFAVVIAYPYIPGSSSEAFKGVSLFVGLLLSLGSTPVIANIIAGYTMTSRRAFRRGDLIRVGGTLGEVVEARLLVTHLRSPKNEQVIVPNSTLLNSEITNYTAMAKKEALILHTQVGIGYETPWRQVEAMLIEAATRTEGILTEPPPFVLQKALTDFAVTYELNACSKQASRMMQIYSQLHQNIQDVFNQYGVQIMTPHYEADTDQPKLVPKEQWFAAPAVQTNPND